MKKMKKGEKEWGGGEVKVVEGIGERGGGERW